MYDPKIHHRHSIRIPKYDYSQNGYYFITICIENKRKILANIIYGENSKNNVGAGPVSAQNIKNEFIKLQLTKIGNIIEKNYLNIENEFKNIKLHDYVIMPNHIHGIIEITERADTGPAPTISDIICSFKTRTTHEISLGIKDGKYAPYQKRFWQRNYYEHVIRNEKEYLRILEYIQYNPLNWIYDKYY